MLTILPTVLTRKHLELLEIILKTIYFEGVCKYSQGMTLLIDIASKTLRLDLCPEFMREGGGAGLSFLLHFSQQFLPILDGICVEKSKLRCSRFYFTLKPMKYPIVKN